MQKYQFPSLEVISFISHVPTTCRTTQSICDTQVIFSAGCFEGGCPYAIFYQQFTTPYMLPSIIPLDIYQMENYMAHWWSVQTPNAYVHPYMDPAPLVYWLPYPNPISMEQPKINEDSRENIRKNSRWTTPKSSKSRCSNMLPNIIRKMLRFIHSRDARQLLLRSSMNLSRDDIEQFYKKLHNKSIDISGYYGIKQIGRLWFNDPDTSYQRIFRLISSYYLSGPCINHIILSKKIRPHMKKQHLRYRRKLMLLLKEGIWKGDSREYKPV